MSGDVAGHVVQADTVHGGVHVHTADGSPTPGISGQRDAWFMPMPGTDGVIERPELVDAVVDALSADATPVALTGLEGAGGFGKTTLAALVCRDERVLAQFPGGVLWKALGQQVKGAEITTAVNDLVEYLTGRRPTYSDPQLAGGHLAGVIGDRRCLLVLDNVWRADQLAPFLVGAPNCVRLVTSRIGTVVPSKAACVRVEALTEGQAEALLGRSLEVDRATLSGLVLRTGRWPVLCGLVNGILRRLAARGDSPIQAIRWAEAMLDTGGPAALDTTDPGARDQAIAKTIEASLSMLAEVDPAAVDRYRELGVFRTDTDLPLETLTRYWHHTGDLAPHEAERLCYVYAEVNLIKDFHLDPPTIRLHDVIAAYLKHSARSRATALHGALLDCFRPGLIDVDEVTTAWWCLPADEPYLWRHLTYHLHQAGRTDELAGLLGDLRWASTKIHHLGPTSVEADVSVVPEDEFSQALGQLARATGHLHQPDDALAMTTATFASYAAGVPILASAAQRLAERITTTHLRPTVLPLPDHPHPAVGRVLAVRHAGTLVVDPKGRWLASGGYRVPVRIWDPIEGTEMFELPGSGECQTLAVSPDGRLVASHEHAKSFGDESLVRVWNMPEGTERVVLTGDRGWNGCLVFAPPDGHWLASRESYETITIWDMTHGTKHTTLSGCSYRGKKMAWAPDGSWLAVAATLRGKCWMTAWIWRFADDVRLNLGPASTHDEPARALAVAPDGSWLATAEFGQVRLWDPNAGSQIRVLKGHSGWVSALAVAPDGTWLAGCGQDGTVRVWNPATGVEVGQLTGHVREITALEVAPTGAWLAGAAEDGSIQVWNMVDHATRTVLTGHSQPANELRAAPDGTWLASASDDDTIRLWNLESTHDGAGLPGYAAKITALVMAPDGSWVASAGNDGTVSLWDTVDGTERAVLHGHSDRVSSLVVAPDGSWLASAGPDGTVRLWDIADRSERAVFTLDSSSRTPVHLVVAPDGRWLAAAGQTVQVWNTRTHKRLRCPRAAETSTSSLAVAGDGSWLAGASPDGLVRLWNPTKGTHLRTLPIVGAQLNALAAAPDGSWLACMEKHGPITVWNAHHKTFMATLRGDDARTRKLVVAPDGSWIADLGYHRAARIWHLPSATQPSTVHQAHVANDVAVAPDCSWLASVSNDGVVRMFDPQGRTRASIRVDSNLAHCVVNPARPQIVAAGARHVYFLDIHDEPSNSAQATGTAPPTATDYIRLKPF